MYAHKEAIMKRNSIYKKALVLAAVLALALILLVGCGQTTSGDSNLNQFVKPDTGSQQQTETVKTALSGDAARQLLLTSIINAKTIEPNSRYITFSFAPYVYVEKEGKTDKYTVKVQGSIDTLGGRDDKQYPVNESVMTFEVLKESADLTTVVLGIYAKGGDMYIDFNDYATGKAVHRYYVSDSDIAYVVGLFKDILNQLKIEEVLTDYDLGSLINDASIKKLISDILHTDSDDKLTLFNIMLSLISESGSYSVTNPDGSVDLVMPTKLNAIFAPPQGTPALLLEQVGKVVNNLLGGQSDIIKGVVNFLVGDILSGKKTLNTAFVANISNNRFQKLALNVVSTKGSVDKTMELGVGGLSKSADFANEVKNSMPELVKADRKNYSFTTLSADLDINLDIAKQEYSIENIDGAVGGAIAKALEGITGTEIYKKSDAIQILEPLPISLHLKLRAEINLKDNKKTRAVIELNGKDKKGNDRTYLGLYYIGADNALYADMSGLGGGKAMIPDINLNQILKDLIAAKIPEIPSIMEIIGGKGSSAASGDVINAGLIEAVQTAMDNGELVVTHYGLAAGDEDSAAVEETASLDIMALIGCLNIVKGDSTPLTVESISASLTKDVIAGLMGKLGMKLPIDQLDLKIYQTREDYPQGEEGWKIDVAVNMATEERGQILGANVGLFLNYGNPDPSLDGYLKGKEFKSAEEGGEYINAGKLTYKDGEFDFDLWVSIGLELELEFNIRENSVLDLSALGKLLYNLALKVESPDGVNAKFNLKINANANVMALVNAIKNGADVAKILSAVDARIDITTGEGQNAKTAVLLLEDGMLYLNSSDGQFRKYKINILEALGGNFKLFGKDVSGTGSALASGEGDTTEGEGGDAPATEEKAKFDIVGLLLANINCISVNRDRLEVAIADTLITALLNGLGVDTEIVKGLNFSNNGTAISLEYDGLNLSKLWLKANVGIQQGDNAALGLGLGLGHIVLTVGKRNLAALGERNILEDEYQDLLNGGNVYLGLGAEIDVALDDETYVLEDLLGALVANFALGTTIDIKDEIKGGLTFNIVADIDISSKPDQNDSRILIEIRKKSNKKVFLGLYYDQKTTTLYLKTEGGTIIQPVALKFDLIGLLEGLINKGDGTASADIDLSELNPVILLSNKGLQIQVMTGVMKLLVGVLVGDMNDYIEYNAGATSYKYYAYDANTDYTILQNAYPLANPVGQKDLYQRNVDKYVYENGEFTLNNDYVGNDFFVKAKEGSFFYVLKDNATGIDEKYFEKNADGTLKEFANSGRNFTLIDASNKDIYASAPKYYQSEFKRADTLMFDMDKDVMEFTKGFIPAYNKTSGLTTYVKVDASKQEVALYEVFTQGYTMKDVFDENGNPTGETKRMELKLPELGASIVIGKIEDGDVSVVAGGTKFSGIGIGIFIMRNGQSDPHGVHYVKIVADETYTGTRYNLVDGEYQEAADGEYKQVANTAANVAIKLGNIQLSEKTFKENYGVTFEQFIDGLQNENLPQADATNIADLTVYVNVEAGIEIGAIKTAAGGDTWAIGGLLSGIVGGSDKDPSALANFLKSLLIKFNVQDEFKDVIGLRIAGNVNLGALLSGNTKDTMQIVKALLTKSDLAVELTDDYPWAATKNTVVGIYVTEGTIYININGDKTIKDTKLKIGVDKVLGMVGGASTGALASADVKGVDGILSIVNNIVKEISIYRNDEASGMTISLSKNMLGAILQLVADIDGVDLKLNEENSFIELNTKVTDKKPYLLKLSVGIDPLVLGIALGGLKIGLAANSDVLKNLNKADYKGLSEIETMALDVEIGVDLGLKQGEFPIGKLVSGILQATGTDLEFPLNLDIQNELDLDLRVRLAGNLNLKEFGKSDLMLQVRNAAPGKEKTILGLYFTTEKDATGKDIPCLYVETQFFSQSAPVRSKVENFDLLGSLLGKTVSGVVEYLGGKVEGTGAALASDDGSTTNEAEIILELASKSIQVKIAEETVKGLLEALVGDKVGDDIIEIINGLGLSAEVAVNLKDENKPLLSVVATCSYLDLGILVNKVNLSTQKQDIFGTTLSGNTWTKTEDAKKSALGVQFGVELNYDISNGKHSLDAILSNVASAAAFEKDATMATVGSILKAVSLDAIIKNTHGSIGIDVVLNVKSEKMTEYLVPAGQALYELVMGKLGAEYTAGEGKAKYDPLELLNMVEALIKINLNGNPVFVSLKDGYVYVSLSAVGGDNFKASLKNIIDQIKKTTGSGSSALATGEGDGETDNKKTDYVLVNKILQNLLASASISDTGLDLALAPNLMNVLLENVVAKLLGDTFGFNDDVKAMFTLSSPYAKLSDGKTSVDDVLYTEKVEERFVRYNAAFESQQGSEQYFFDAEAKVYRKLYKADATDATTYVVYTGGEVQTLYYFSDADEYVALTAEQLAASRFVMYSHKSYLAVYDSADKATRNVVKASEFVAGTTVYDANGNSVAEDNLFVKVKHSGIGWTKDNGISIDLVFDNPNTTKAPDFSIGLGLDATLVLQGEAIEVIPYFVKKAGAKPLNNQEVKGYFKEGTALVEIPASEVYTGTRYDKDGNVDENGKFRKELAPGTEAEHDLVLIGNIFPEVSDTVGDEKIYLSMELGLTLEGTGGTNDRILDFVADIIDVSNRTSTTMKYVEFAEGEDKAGYEGQRYSKTGAMSYAQDVNGTFKRGAYYLAETGYVGTKFVKNTDGTFTIADNGTYKFVADDSAKTYFPILPEEAETYPADKKYREDGKGFVTDANGDFKAGEYSVTDRTKGGAKFRLNAKSGKYFVYEATGITLYKQGNYYEIDKDELATFKGVRFDYDSVNKVATVNPSGKYQFVAEEGAYYPVLENDGYTGKLYRVSEASTPDNTIYIEDVIYKFTPAFTGKDLKDLNALAKLLVSIGEFEAEARVKVTVGANVAELVKALSNTANIDIAELLKHVELAIESLDSRGTVKGGIYLYNSTLYIKYINTSRGIFSMPVSELFGAIASASAEERMPYEAAMLQLWVGEFIKLNGVYTTGIAVQATTSLVETLLETLLGFEKGTISLAAFGAVGVEVTIVTASPIFPENADGEVYVKKAYDFVALTEGEAYDGEKYVLLENGEYGEIAKGSEDKFSGQTLYKRVAKAEADVSYVKLSEAGILSDCEGYDSAYAEALTTRYTKVTKTDGTEIFEELKFGFDFNSFGIGIGLKIGHVGFNLNIGKIDLGLIDGTQSIVPDEVKNAPIAQETVIDLSLEVNLGLEFMDKNTNATTGFDLGKFVDGLGVLTGVNLGADWLKLTVPEGGAEVRLSLRVALALNLTNVDHSVAAIEIVGQIFENGVNIGEKTLIGVYYKDGNVLLNLAGLGFDNIRISGLRLSDLLGGSNGVEILKKLLGGSGSSSALASEVNFTVVGNDEFGSPAAALILDSNRIAVEVGSLFIEKLLGIAALGLDENTQKLLGGLDLKALVEVNFGEKFVEIPSGETFSGTKYAYDNETKKYYIDNDNGNFKRESNISLKLNAEAAELLGINVAVENIKIGNTGVEEKVKAIDINDYAEFIEILFGTEKDENGNEIVDANGKPKKKIVGFEPKLEALTLSLDIDLGAMFTNGMAMGRSILDSEGKTVLTNVSSVGAIGNGNMGIRASVKLEIAFAALLNKLQQGFDSSDIFAAIEQALPLVKAQISIYAQSDGDELIGIYVADGNVYLMLDGLGMPNIKVTGEFLMDIIRAATGSGTALSSDEATASVETSQIIGIVKQIVQGISVGGKALKVAFQNDYFAKLIDAVLSIVLNKNIDYYNKVMPEVPTDVAFSGLTINLAGIENTYEPIYRKDGKYYFDAGCTSQYYGMVFFKNTVTNHIELFSEKEYVKQFGEVDETTMFYRSTRNGLVELDLVAYSTHLKLAVNMPKLGAQKNIISSPEVAGVAFTEADEVTGVALGLKGQVKIDKQPGIALANILSGVVGDLETKLVIEEDIDIRFAIEAAVGIKYSLKDKSFALSAVDLRISLARYYATDNKTVPLAVLTYISSEGTLYVDVSHFFQKQNEGNNKNLGMLKITGVNVLDLINGLITGEGSATSVALGSSDAWVEDEQQPYTYVYYEANAINSAAPAKFVHVAQLNDKDEPRMVYRNYTGTITAEFKTEDGKDLYVRDRSNKVTGYTLLNAENAEKFSHKAKYTYEQAMTYTKLTDLYVMNADGTYVLAAGDADVTNTALYRKVIDKYVEIADGEIVNAEDRYEQNADGTYTQNANGTFKAVYKFVKVSDGSAWYIEEYNSETCKYDYNVYDPANPDHNAPKLYHYDETEKKYAEGAGEDGAKSYVKVPVYSISAVWADLRNYGIADNVAGYDVASNAKVNITGKAMLGLIGGLVNNADLEDILDALLVSVHATKDPFIFGADIGILDVYNDHKLALNVGLNIFGFDFEKKDGAGNTDGSYLEFLDAENTISFRPANADKYRQFADVDLNRILSASEIMDVLVDSLDFGKSGKIYLNLSLDADSFAKDTGDNFVPWEKYFAALLGLNQNSARVLYQVLFPESELDGNGNFSIDIAAAIDVKKLLGGLIAGTGLNLEGTEIRITINSDTMLFSEDSRKDGSKIVITAIGEADGILSVFIDNSGYRGKGKHVARLDLNAILGTATSSAAYASANENTGLIDEKIFGVMNALLGEVRLGGGKISIVLRENFIGALLNTLVGTDITEQQSLVKGEIYIDLRNLEVGIEMILGDDNYVSEGERDFYIGLRIGGINLTAPDGFDMTEYTFIKKAERANFKNIKQLKLDINFESEWYYDATNKTEGFDISPVVDILETILKKELFPDRLLQVLVKDDKIDAVYATAISAHIDLADFNNMKLSVEIFKSTSEEPVRELKLGVYLDGQSVYVDLSGWGLPKIKLGGLNLGNTINDALLPLLDQYLVGDDNKRGGETAALASSYVGDYDKNHIEYSDFVEAADGKYVLVYTENNSGGYVLVNGKYVKYNAKVHAGATRYARNVEEYDAANEAHQNVTRYNVNKGAFRTSWGKVLFPVAYEEDENGGYVLIDGKYVPYNAGEHAGQKRYKEVSGNKPYISLLLANNRFGFGINADLINSLLETILGALNLDIQLPDFGDAVLLFDSRKDLNGDGYADTQLDLAVQVNDNLYFGFRTTNLEITGNSTEVSHAERRYAEVVGDGKEFVTVYDIEKGEIGLETVALGFNVQIRQNCVDNGQSDFEKYLGVLLKSLLGINNFTLNLPSSGEIGCDIDLRVSLNIANLVKALQGGNVDWWSDIELYLDLKPMGYGSLLTMYKQKGDADVYADLSGLSLFKVKIIGLQSLIGGLVSASATALASGDNEVAIASASGDIAKLTIIPGKVGFTIEIGWGFIEGLLTSLLGDTLHVADGTGELEGYKTITIGEGATATVIPLPNMNNDRALSLSINHASAMYNRSLEIDLKLGFNKSDESAVNLKIHNFVLTSGQEKSARYIRFGATKGKINETGTGNGVLDAITGTNANAYSGLVLSDAKGISLVNILTSVIKGIDPDISITWHKSTNHYYTNSKRESYGETWSTIELSRTTKATTHIMDGSERTYAGKFFAYINNDQNREIGAWLFNNQLYIDITKTLDVTLGIGALRKMKVADLDILGLLGGLGSASATNAMASDGATTEKSLKDTVSGFVKGVQVNWWNNQTVVDKNLGVGDRAITTIRVDLNGKGLNNILAKVYYLLYGMYDTNAPAAELFSEEALYRMVYTEGQDVTLKDGTVVKSVNAHEKCVFYLQTFAANMIGSSVNGTLGGWLKPGGSFGKVLREILGRLLPLPKLDEAENGRPSYVEIVIDKSRLASGKGVLKQIALMINKERTKNNGSTITPEPIIDDTAEIVINLDNNVTLRSVSAVRDYNTNSTKPNEDSGKTINVANPFDPVELTTAALNSAGLLDRVAADFYGISEYDSKSEKGVTDSYAELGGTPIVWDTSTAILEPGKESEIWGYALNYKVQKVKVKVSNSTGFLRLFGYFKADGTTFVETNKITVDPTKDPTGTDNISAGLPRIIVIMRRDGELQVLSRDYDKDKPGTVNINGTDYTVDGKFNWIDEDTVEEGATVEKLFWYQVGYSSRIQKSIKVKYNNVDIVSGSLPNDDKFGILNGGTAFDFTPENFDIVGNLGLPSIKASETFAKNGDKFSYVGFDGSTYEFTPGTAPTNETELAEWNKHTLGGNGMFTRSFNGKVLQSGTYTYVAAESTAAGILDSLGGLFGGSNANADSGKYALSVAIAPISEDATFTKNGDKFSYVGFDGSTYEFTPGTAPTDETELAEWNKHALGGNGKFTRSFNGNVLQSGKYKYVPAAGTDGKGTYEFEDYYTGLKEITVKLGTGKTTTVDVIEWNYDDFKYDMRKPQNGASGRIVAVINKYEIKRTTGLVEKTEVVNSKQKIRLDVGITQESLSALADGDLKFNQYEDAFVLSATGDYVLETRDAFIPYDETLHKDKKQYALVDGKYVDASKASADNTARYVEGKVTGYVYDKYADDKPRYAINIFDAEELYVKVKHSRITSETQQFHVDDFKFYTNTFAAIDKDQTPFTMFVVPKLGVKTERNITVKALYDVNGAYEQIFDIKVVVTPKVATKVVLLIDNDRLIDRTYLESTAEVTVYYKDGTEKQGLAKDLIRLTDKEIEKIANAKDHLGITYGTASVFKKGRYELIAAGETYDGQRFNLVDGNFVEAADGAYKFFEDETFVQNGVTFEIRVFSKN